MFRGDVDYAINAAKALVGYEIVGVCEDPKEDSYGFILSRKGKEGRKLVWIDRDPEGNGPGWISVSDQP